MNTVCGERVQGCSCEVTSYMWLAVELSRCTHTRRFICNFVRASGCVANVGWAAREVENRCRRIHPISLLATLIQLGCNHQKLMLKEPRLKTGPRLTQWLKLKLKVACGAFSALQPVGRLYPCPNEFPSIISRGATHHIGTRDLC